MNAVVVSSKEKKIMTVVIVVLIFLIENSFYLINVSELKIGLATYEDIWLIFLLMIDAWLVIKFRNTKFKSLKFGFPILLILIAIVISSFREFIITGQPIVLGLQPQRFFSIILISYFPFRLAFQEKLINYKNFQDIIIGLGLVQAYLYIVQSLVYPSVIIIHASSGVRYGGVRFWIDSVVIVLACIMACSNILKKLKLSHLIMILGALGYEFLVSKGKLETIVLISVCLFILFFSKASVSKKMWHILFVVVILIILVNSSTVANIFDQVIQYFSGNRNVNYIDTMSGREAGRSFYWNKLSQSLDNFLFGNGYPNKNYYPAMLASGSAFNFLLVDNGFLAFFFVYGLFGVLGVILFFINYMKLCLKKYKENNEISFLAFGIFILFLSYNITFWWWKFEWTLIFVFLAIIAENSLNESKRAETLYEN